MCDELLASFKGSDKSLLAEEVHDFSVSFVFDQIVKLGKSSIHLGNNANKTLKGFPRALKNI